MKDYLKGPLEDTPRSFRFTYYAVSFVFCFLVVAAADWLFGRNPRWIQSAGISLVIVIAEIAMVEYKAAKKARQSGQSDQPNPPK